jgi:hypothetical protein
MKIRLLLLVPVLGTALAVTGYAGTASASTVSPGARLAPAAPAPCIIDGHPCPKSGYYHPPRTVVLHNGGGYKTSLVLEHVDSYAPGTVPTVFELYWKALVTGSRPITFTCRDPQGQLIGPSTTHMFLYRHGTNIGYVPGFSSTCGKDPNYKQKVQPGHASDWWIEFNYVPHPEDQISISQLADSSIKFHPFGTPKLTRRKIDAGSNPLISLIKGLIRSAHLTGDQKNDVLGLITDFIGCEADPNPVNNPACATYLIDAFLFTQPQPAS